DASRTAEALHACDQGIALLRGLPLDRDPRFPRRLAIAYQNRGLVLQSLGPSSGPEAIQAFTHAITVLTQGYSSAIPDRQYVLAVVWMNLANVYAAAATIESGALARDAAMCAITMVKDQEESDAAAAEVGLKARQVLCQTLAARLSLPSS